MAVPKRDWKKVALLTRFFCAKKSLANKWPIKGQTDERKNGRSIQAPDIRCKM